MNSAVPMNGELIAQKVQNFIAKQHNYYLVQNNGQRIFKLKDDPGVPPPPKGTEIFVGKLPRDFFEDELVPLFSKIGPIYKLRLMVDFSGKNRGYGFVTYFTMDNAIAAVEYLNNYEVRKGCKIGVYKSIDNCRLFMGNIPRDKTKEEVTAALQPYVQGLENVILYKSLEDPRENRGFAFLEFDNHRSAAMTRRRLAPGTFFLWEQNITVDWADPLPDVDPIVMGTVRKLYIRNLDINMTSEVLHFRLCEILPAKYSGRIVKVYKSWDYAFIHFAKRTAAEAALAILQNNSLAFGEEIEITWARPKIYSKEHRQTNTPNTFCTSLPPQARRMVHLQQEQAKIENKKRPHQLPASAPAPVHVPQIAQNGYPSYNCVNNYLAFCYQQMSLQPHVQLIA